MKRLFGIFSVLGCATALVGLLGGLTCDVPPAGSEVFENAGIVKLQINNLSGLPAEVNETYILIDEQVRHTLRFLPVDGPGAREGIATLADTIIVQAKVATDADVNSLGQPGELLAAREYRFGVDFQNGDTIIFDIPPPQGPPPPDIIDCNTNGVNDPIDITEGTSVDCDSNAVPDECQPDNDHDSFINPCDGCPNDVNKQGPGTCGCGKPDTGDADEDGILNCVDTCTDTDSDGFGDPGFPANTCPPDGCPDDLFKSAPGVCGCGTPDSGDSDEDGVLNCVDPCPNDSPDDSDSDGLCDSADSCPHDPDNDKDEDGVCGDVDICPGHDDNDDSDEDGTPDGCDACPNANGNDSDSDGVCDDVDICPGHDDKEDTDEDGEPDGCDTCPNDSANDADSDGVCGDVDICPGHDDNDDSDEDGTPDGCDACPNANDDDSDSDGVCDDVNICPGYDDKADTDEDGVPNGCDDCPNDNDNDADSDGVCGDVDICPGHNDNRDSDEDGVPDGCDACPNDGANDADKDGVCGDVDICPGHDDGVNTDDDGIPDGCDACPGPDDCLDGTFNLDILPDDCPNVLSREDDDRDHDLFSVALLGTSTFSVFHVDLSTLELTRADIQSDEVSPVWWLNDFSHVGSPTSTELCGCNSEYSDERKDLKMRFELDDFLEDLQLNELPDGTEVPIKLKGRLYDGTPFAAIDCVKIVSDD